MMPYVFLGLVIVNIAALGYFTFLHEPVDTPTLLETQTQLIKPMAFENNSANVPPIIGTKK